VFTVGIVAAEIPERTDRHTPEGLISHEIVDFRHAKVQKNAKTDSLLVSSGPPGGFGFQRWQAPSIRKQGSKARWFGVRMGIYFVATKIAISE
jgi:hypothetical protein